MTKVNLIYMQPQKGQVAWPLGSVWHAEPQSQALALRLETALEADAADAWLIWDARLGLPNSELILALLDQNCDVWHAGLALGMGGMPEMIDFVSPTWMLNRDPDAAIEATSWRLSLRACLVRAEVLRQLGLPNAEYASLEATGLELGFRYIRKGAFVRHVPSLVEGKMEQKSVEIPVADQMLFIKHGFGEKWLRWAAARAMLERYSKPAELISACRCALRQPKAQVTESLSKEEVRLPKAVCGDVSVLIPTLRRYPYLKVVLDQLRQQTVRPYEVLVVDQTPQPEREPALKEAFADLPIRWFFLDEAGQCSSRNFGIQQAKGEYILFLDDDDEIQPDLIQRHLESLTRYATNISNGVAEEVGSGELPADFRFVRLSDVFPTNNTMIRKSVLDASGLFDLAFDHGQRADHDLGMRLYLQGEKLVLNPAIRVLHHHAPMGGLREHRARVHTYAAARSKVFRLVLPSVSELYLNMRYFTPQQVRERIWIDVLGSFSLKGSLLKRLLKGLAALVWLPRSVWIVRQREKAARKMMERFPQIPFLQGGGS